VDGTDYNTAWAAPPAASLDYGYASVTDNSVHGVVLAGSRIPLNDNVSITSSVRAGGGIFAIFATGTYLVEYTVELASPVAVGFSILRNTQQMLPLTVEPGASRSLYTKSAVVTLNQGEAIELSAYGTLAAITVAEGTLTILRLK